MAGETSARACGAGEAGAGRSAREGGARRQVGGDPAGRQGGAGGAGSEVRGAARQGCRGEGEGDPASGRGGQEPCSAFRRHCGRREVCVRVRARGAGVLGVACCVYVCV